VAGEVVSLAVNFGTSPPTVWILTSKMVGWNNSATANPSTGTGGQALTGLNAGPYFAIFNDDQSGGQVTANFGGSAFTRSVPTGFSAWDTATNITGTLAVTQGSQTLSGAGKVLVSGALTATQASQTLSSAALVINPPAAGTLALTQGAQTLFSLAAVTVAGQLAVTQGAQTLSAAGTVTSAAATGTLTVTQAAQTLTGNAAVLVGGLLQQTAGRLRRRPD